MEWLALTIVLLVVAFRVNHVDSAPVPGRGPGHQTREARGTRASRGTTMEMSP